MAPNKADDFSIDFDMNVELSGSTRTIGTIKWLSSGLASGSKPIARIEPYKGPETGLDGPLAMIAFHSPHGLEESQRIYVDGHGQTADGLYEVIPYPEKEHRELNFLVNLSLREPLSGGQIKVYKRWDVLNPNHIDPRLNAELRSLQVILLDLMAEMDPQEYRLAMIPNLKQMARIGGDHEFVEDLEKLAAKHKINLSERLPDEYFNLSPMEDDLLARLEIAAFKKNARTIEILCDMPKGLVSGARYYPDIVEWAQRAANHVHELTDRASSKGDSEGKEQTEPEPELKTEKKPEPKPEKSIKPQSKKPKSKNTDTPNTSSK